MNKLFKIFLMIVVMLFALSSLNVLAGDQKKSKTAKDAQDDEIINADIEDSVVALNTSVNRLALTTQHIPLSEGFQLSLQAGNKFGGSFSISF